MEQRPNAVKQPMDYKWLFFSFNGRINRAPYWGFFAFTVLLSIVSSRITTTTGNDTLELVFMLIILWPALAIQAKRWHDIDRSAWFILVNIIPVIGPIWAVIANGFLAGTPGENRFGQDPLGIAGGR